MLCLYRVLEYVQLLLALTRLLYTTPLIVLGAVLQSRASTALVPRPALFISSETLLTDK